MPNLDTLPCFASSLKLVSSSSMSSSQISRQLFKSILEPVRTSFNGLNIAHKILKQHKQFAYLIVNPEVGETA
jgi:hypothetical protein